MLPLVLGKAPDQPLSILCLGAHSDDIEIGCGATVLRLLRERPRTSVVWAVFSADDRRESEARASAADFLSDAEHVDVHVHRFRESYFPYVGDAVKDAFELLKTQVVPDVVFTHRRSDAHQDHRVVADLTWNTFRDHLILEYEIPKYEGDLTQPNMYVPVDAATADRKVELITRHFVSQHSKTWFRTETFRGLMAVRAVECGAESGWAEAFHASKLVI